MTAAIKKSRELTRTNHWRIGGILLAGLFLMACKTTQKLALPVQKADALSGSAFYHLIQDSSWKYREQILQDEILSGNIPSYLRKLVPIRTSVTDSATGKKIHAVYFVTADYLSVGNDLDFARTPMTPMLAQKIADSLHCFCQPEK